MFWNKKKEAVQMPETVTLQITETTGVVVPVTVQPKMMKNQVNWAKLLTLIIANSAVAAIGGTTMGETMGIIASNPKNALKLAGIGAALGAINLLLTVTKKSLNPKFFD